MSGHNKFSKIKHVKAKTDAQKSKSFSKISKLISAEAKKANGNLNSPALKTAIDKAREINMPNDTIERAIKKADTSDISLESVQYETYGPGGVAIIIEALTDNRNRTAPEIKSILKKHDLELGTPGSAAWAFIKTDGILKPTNTLPLSEEDLIKLSDIIESLEDNDDVQEIYTNAE